MIEYALAILAAAALLWLVQPAAMPPEKEDKNPPRDVHG